MHRSNVGTYEFTAHFHSTWKLIFFAGGRTYAAQMSTLKISRVKLLSQRHDGRGGTPILQSKDNGMPTLRGAFMFVGTSKRQFKIPHAQTILYILYNILYNNIRMSSIKLYIHMSTAKYYTIIIITIRINLAKCRS